MGTVAPDTVPGKNKGGEFIRRVCLNGSGGNPRAGKIQCMHLDQVFFWSL